MQAIENYNKGGRDGQKNKMKERKRNRNPKWKESNHP